MKRKKSGRRYYMLTVEHVRESFRDFNKKYFEGRLTEPKEIIVVPAGQQGNVVNRCSDWAGYEEKPGDNNRLEIRALSQELDGRFFNGILLHEMLHVEVGTEHDHRSRAYRQARLRIAREHPEVLKELI